VQVVADAFYGPIIIQWDNSNSRWKLLLANITSGSGGIPDDNSVSTAKIVSKAVTTEKIDDDAITAGQIETRAVGTIAIAYDAIQSPQIADNAVDTEHITDGSITAAKLASGVGGTMESVEGDNVDNTNPDEPVIWPQIITGEIDSKASALYSVSAIGTKRVVQNSHADNEGVVLVINMESFATNVAGDKLQLETMMAGDGYTIATLTDANGSALSGGEMSGIVMLQFKYIGAGQWRIITPGVQTVTGTAVSGTATNPIINSTSSSSSLSDISRILFDSTTTPPTITSQENIDAITDNDKGDFDLNFDSNMTADGTGAAADYTWSGSAESDNTDKGTFTVSSPSEGTKTVSLLQVNVVNEGGNLKDSDNISVMVFPAGDT